MILFFLCGDVVVSDMTIPVNFAWCLYVIQRVLCKVQPDKNLHTI